MSDKEKAYQMLGRLGHFPYGVSLVQICMNSFVVNRDIQINNVSFLQWAVIWDSMTNDLVYGGTNGLGKPPVVEW